MRTAPQVWRVYLLCMQRNCSTQASRQNPIASHLWTAGAFQEIQPKKKNPGPPPRQTDCCCRRRRRALGCEEYGGSKKSHRRMRKDTSDCRHTADHDCFPADTAHVENTTYSAEVDRLSGTAAPLPVCNSRKCIGVARDDKSAYTTNRPDIKATTSQPVSDAADYMCKSRRQVEGGCGRWRRGDARRNSARL